MSIYRIYSSLPEVEIATKRALIDTSALMSNYKALVGKIPSGAEGIAVVKADAYGHSNDICAPALYEAGCRFFAVSCLAEAISLRNVLKKCNDAKILILGYTLPESVELLGEYDIIQCVFSLDYAKQLSAAANDKIKVHIKLNTGMNRLGFEANSVSDAPATAREIFEVSKLKNIEITGMFTHFSEADEFTDAGDEFTRQQFANFCAVERELKGLGVNVGFRHVCNSAGALRFPEFILDGVRFGIVMYGGGDRRLTDRLDIRPVMSLETVISSVHELRRGEVVGYGGDFTAERDMKIVTMPIGYADGFLRYYEGATVTVKTATGDKKLKLIGKICMDQCMADATGVDVAVCDRVTLFGNDRSELDDLARRAGTIDYECLCLVSSRVPRIVK